MENIEKKYDKFNDEKAYKVFDKYFRTLEPNQSEKYYLEKVKKQIEESRVSNIKFILWHQYHHRYKYDYEYAQYITNEIIKGLPKEVYPNIEEWGNNEPISEIDYYGYSIKKIIDWANDNNIKCPFGEYLNAMSLFVRSGCNNSNICNDYLMGFNIIMFEDGEDKEKGKRKIRYGKFDINKARNIFSQIVQYEYPNISKEFCKEQVKKELKLARYNSLKNAMIHYYSYEREIRFPYAQKRVCKILDGKLNKELNGEYAKHKITYPRLPVKLYPNIEEWLNHEPISDIEYRGYSIKQMMVDTRDISIAQLFEDYIYAMQLYIGTGCKKKSPCFQHFKRKSILYYDFENSINIDEDDDKEYDEDDKKNIIKEINQENKKFDFLTFLKNKPRF